MKFCFIICFKLKSREGGEKGNHFPISMREIKIVFNTIINMREIKIAFNTRIVNEKA